RMHRLRGVALVTDRLGDQSFELAVILRAQFIDVARGRFFVRLQNLLARVPLDLVDEKNQLAVTVVLRNGIGAAFVDAARNFSVVVLKRREPRRELLRDGGMSESQQQRRDERAVANPRALVRARARLQSGAVAWDE